MGEINKTADNMILLGKISGLFGVKGWVKVHSDTEPRENILNYLPWYLDLNGQWQAMKVVESNKHGKGLIVRFVDCHDRDVSAALVGKRIAIKPEQLPPAEAGEYYWRDLQGLKVSNLEGIELGMISSMMETGSNDVMVVRNKDSKDESKLDRLIPFIQDQVVKEVNLDEGWMIVDWDADF
ncbi:MAG: ribosome maturation factor RimM [Gammaproteobacteria bacterium]|nr:ribosome maturation factor RimM [Gammaproteobacteria bacterium]